MAEKKRLRIHLLVEAAGGPIRSEPPAGLLETLPGAKARRLGFACDPTLPMTELDRGTPLDAPWTVRCDACRKTAAFMAVARPRPGRPTDEQMEADGTDCCG